MVQMFALAFETFPMPQFRQVSDIREENSPAEQSEQVRWSLVNCPPGHASHLRAPDADTVPFGHSLHSFWRRKDPAGQITISSIEKSRKVEVKDKNNSTGLKFIEVLTTFNGAGHRDDFVCFVETLACARLESKIFSMRRMQDCNWWMIAVVNEGGICNR